MATHKEKRAAKRAAAALAAGLVPHAADLPPVPTAEEQMRAHLEKMEPPAPLPPGKLRNRQLARKMMLLLAASKLRYKNDLTSILGQYRTALAQALETFGTGWDARAAAVEAHYLWQLPAMVGRVFDAMWPGLVVALEEQAKEQGLQPVVPDKATWRQESQRLMDKSARELGMDMRRGETPDDIGVGRAGVIAEDQVHKMAAEANQSAQRAAGADSFVWSGMMDERERPEHVALEGRVLSWAEGADGLFPGQAVNCRCVAVAVRP
jgi:SPP1 gp7 family putative phage head morphogenesis protein